MVLIILNKYNNYDGDDDSDDTDDDGNYDIYEPKASVVCLKYL